MQKPRLELEYLLEPQSRPGCFRALTAGWVTMTKTPSEPEVTYPQFAERRRGAQIAHPVGL